MRTVKIKKFRNQILIIGTVLTSIVYIIWRMFYTLPFGYGFIFMAAAIYLLVVEFVGLLEEAVHYYNMSDIQYPERPEVDENLFPDVDVFVATYNEPVEILYKTINGCINMDYPDKSKVHIYICDDGNREEMRELAEKLNVNYITRTEHKHAKAGNLNNALSQTSSPLVVTFDADMIPMHDFLTACVPYFVEDLENAKKIEMEKGKKASYKRENKIGFIQTPQSFYNPDLFQYNLFSERRIPNEQDYFYRDIQVARNKSNSVIYGGSNTVISREALEVIGGFYTKVITEDFATGMLIQSNGYKCYAIDEVHAVGLSAEDLKGLVKQRQRWARGCIQTGRKLNILFRKGLKFSQKLSYISAISYWYGSLKRLIYIMAPILFSVFDITVFRCNLWQILIFWFPMYLFSSKSLKLVSKNIRTTKWTNVYETIMFPSLIIVVLLESFGITQSKFAVTRKGGAVEDKNYQYKKAVPHIILAILSVIGICRCIKWTFESGTPTFIVLIFWLVLNMYNIVMSIFFMLGRKVNRKYIRFRLNEKAVISFEDKEIVCDTYDISEGGIAVISDSPEYIPYDRRIDISVKTERYSTKFKASIVQVNEIKGSFKYSFKIDEIDEDNFKQLLGVVYDRVPSLPKNIEKNNSIFDDIRINILRRTAKPITFKRKSVRIDLNKKIQSLECGIVEIVNFNYDYIAVKTDIRHKDINNLTIKAGNDINLECRYVKNLNFMKLNPMELKIKSIQLYEIQNKDDIKYSDEFRKILEQWIRENEFDSMNRNNSKKSYISNDEFLEMDYV